jgi:hypothetical protein
MTNEVMTNKVMKEEAINHLKAILTQTYPLCKDGNPNEREFQEINRRAHQAVFLVERLGVEKLV